MGEVYCEVAQLPHRRVSELARASRFRALVSLDVRLLKQRASVARVAGMGRVGSNHAAVVRRRADTLRAPGCADPPSLRCALRKLGDRTALQRHYLGRDSVDGCVEVGLAAAYPVGRRSCDVPCGVDVGGAHARSRAAEVVHVQAQDCA